MQPIRGTHGIALPDDLVSLVSWIAQNALVSPALALKTILPEIPKRPGREAQFRPEVKEATIRMTRSRAEEVGALVRSLVAEERPCSILRYRDPAEKLVALLTIASSFQKKKQTLLILVPKQNDLAGIEPVLRKRFPDLAVLRSGLRSADLWREWNRCRAGDAPLVLGTRSAVFAPLPNIHGVVICDDEASEYKAEDAPRLDARTVAEERARKNSAILIAVSQAPRSETVATAAKYGSPVNLAPLNQHTAEIVDLRNEVRERGKILSDTFQTAAENALESGNAIIIFQNRRGSGSSLQCKDCGMIFLCPECDIPWSVHEKALVCHHCGRTSELPLSCEACGGNRLKSSGAGTQRIEAELLARFPNRRILRLDTDAPEAESASVQNADIVIGTRLLAGRYLETLERTRRIGLVAVPLAESLFGRADFRAAEQAYQWLVSIINIGTRNRARTIIQTFRPEHTVLQSAATGTDKFYEEEMQSRKTFGYPPFSRLILLSVREKQESAAREAAEKTATTFRSELRDAEVIGPFAPMPKKRRGMFEWRLLVKSAPNLPPPEELRALPEEWTIDVDPETV